MLAFGSHRLRRYRGNKGDKAPCGSYEILAMSSRYETNSVAYLKREMRCYNASILFHMADEQCNNAPFIKLYEHFRAVYRNYGCYNEYVNEYARLPYGLLKIIPIFWSQTLPAPLVPMLKSSMQDVGRCRSTVWYFSGTLGQDHGQREAALNAMCGVKPHAYSQLRLTQEEVSARLLAAYFTLAPRGWKRLESYRAYEASLHGSIPITASRYDRISSAFYHFHSHPPWIIVDSWEAAIPIVSKLPRDVDQLHKRQFAVLQWMFEEWVSVRRRLATDLSLPPAAVQVVQDEFKEYTTAVNIGFNRTSCDAIVTEPLGAARGGALFPVPSAEYTRVPPRWGKGTACGGALSPCPAPDTPEYLRVGDRYGPWRSFLPQKQASPSPTYCLEGTECQCKGTVFYVRRFKPGTCSVVELADVPQYRFFQKKFAQAFLCTVRAFDDPAFGEDKHCVCATTSEPERERRSVAHHPVVAHKGHTSLSPLTHPPS